MCVYKTGGIAMLIKKVKESKGYDDWLLAFLYQNNQVNEKEIGKLIRRKREVRAAHTMYLQFISNPNLVELYIQRMKSRNKKGSS